MLVFITALASVMLQAQTVSTIVGPAAQVDDDISRDSQGNLYVSHYDGTSIWKVTLDGTQSLWQGGIIRPNGSTFSAQGDFYFAANQGRGVFQKIDTQNAMPYGPPINRASGVLFDPFSDTLLVTGYTDDVIYKLAPDSTISEFVRGNGLNGPVGLQADANGTYYVSNFDDRKIFRLDRDGTLTIIDQLPGTFLGFIAYADSQIYATGFGTHQIFRVSLDGTREPIAGIANTPGSINGPVSLATFNNPNGIYATADGDTLFVSDYGSKSLRMITGVATAIEPRAAVDINRFQLNANYPNPFNPTTSIRYQLKTTQMVTLEILNTLGQRIAILVDEIQPAGPHTVEWSAESMPGGIYYYRLTSGQASQTRKMALVK